MQRLGRHLIIELWGCDGAAMRSQDMVSDTMIRAIAACGATLLDMRVYPTAFDGINGVAILAESHAMIQTWPAQHYTAVDIFTCGQQTDPNLAVPVLQQCFAPEHIQVLEINRGVIELANAPVIKTVCHLV